MKFKTPAIPVWSATSKNKLVVVLAMLTAFALGFVTPAKAICKTDYNKTDPILLLPQELPKGCFARVREPVSAIAVSNEYTDGQFGYTKIRKRDVVCIGDRIVINKSIYTNGGDVQIFANTVEFTEENAKIDTRIYSSTSLFAKVRPGVAAETTRSLSEKCNTTEYGIRTATAYDTYYENCIDCISVVGTSLVPRMPDGAIVPYKSSIFDGPVPKLPGIRAPVASELVQDVLKSGKVDIFHNLFLRPQEVTNSEKRYVCETPFNEDTNFYFINTSGLYGGRGGAGSAATCEVNPGAKFGCLTWAYINTGASGNGGPGGDGGDINFHYYNIGDAGSNFASHRYRGFLKTEGGVAGPSKSYLAPASDGEFVAANGVCDFVRPDRSVSAFDPSPSGKSGTKDVVQKAVTVAFQDFTFNVLKLDATNAYDFLFAAENAQIDSLGKITFADHLAVELNSLAVDQQNSLIKEVISLVEGSDNTFEQKLPGAFYRINYDELPSNLFPKLLQQVTTRLNSLRVFQFNRPYDYLYRTGGLFNLQQKQPDLLTLLDNLKTIVFDSSVTLEAIKQNLVEANGIRKLNQLSASKQLLEDKVDQLQKSLANAQSALDDEKSFVESLKPAFELFKGVAKAATSFTSGEYVAGAVAVAKLYEDIQKERTASGVSGSAFASALENVPRFKTEIRQTEQLIFEIVSEINNATMKANIEAQKSLVDFTKGDLAVKIKQVEAGQNFGEILRWSLIAYLTDPNRDEDLLKSRLSGLSRLIGGEDWQTVSFSFPDLDNKRCIKFSPNCQKFSALGKQILAFKFTNELENSIELPAYFINAQNVTFELSDFGYDIYAASLPWSEGQDSEGIPPCEGPQCKLMVPN
jgi:hypothetical protein